MCTEPPGERKGSVRRFEVSGCFLPSRKRRLAFRLGVLVIAMLAQRGRLYWLLGAAGVAPALVECVGEVFRELADLLRLTHTSLEVSRWISFGRVG